jgi:hypothetical protein
MKLKTGFRGLLLPARKRLILKRIRSHFDNDPELYYAVGLVVLWLVVFIIIHLKYLTNLK